MADDTSALKKSSPYFSTNLGRSGIYDGVGNDEGEYKIDEKERVKNEPDYNERDQETSQRESGAYKRYISSSKQTDPAENIINGKKVIQDRDRPLDGDGRSTPDSGVYSKNIEHSERGQESYNVGNGSDGRNSNENRESGDYGRNIRPHADNAFMANDNQTQWPKSFKTSNYSGRTLEAPFENDEDLPVETGAGKTENNTDFSKSKMYTKKHESQEFDDISNRSYVSTKELPLWTKLISDPEITNQYFNQKWPRISLQLPKARGSDAFSVPKTADTDDCVADSNKGEHTARCTAFVIGIGVVLMLLVAAAITTIAILTKESEPDSSTFSKINMRLTVNQNYTLDLDDKQSHSYQTFTTNFCKEIDIVFRNSTNGFGSKYDHCSVTSLSSGSVIVNFSLFTISLSDNEAYSADDILNSSLRTNKDNLGSFKVVTGTLTLISIEPIQIIPTTTPVTITTSTLAETTTTAMTETSTQKVETTTSSANVFTTTTVALLMTGSSTKEAEVTTLSANLTAETTITNTKTTKAEPTTQTANVPTTTTTTTETTTQTAETSPTNVPTTTTMTTETTTQTAVTSPTTVSTTTTTTTKTTTQTAETSPTNISTTNTAGSETTTQTAETSPSNVPTTTTKTIETTTQAAETSTTNVPTTNTTRTETTTQIPETSPANVPTTTTTTTEITTQTAETSPSNVPTTTFTTTETTTQTAKTSPENVSATRITPETTIPTVEKTSPANLLTTTTNTETTNEIDTKTATTTTTQQPTETSASVTEMTKTTTIANTTPDGLSTIQDNETSLLTHSAETQTTTSLFNNSTVKILTSTTMTATTTTNAQGSPSTSPTVSVSSDSSTETTGQQSSTNKDVATETGSQASSQTQITTLHVPRSTTMSNGDSSTTLLSPDSSTTENAQHPTTSPSPRTYSTMTEETIETSSTKHVETTSVSEITEDLSPSHSSTKMTEVTTAKTTKDAITSNIITSEQTTDTNTTTIEHTSDITSASGINYTSKTEKTTIETSATFPTKPALTDSPTTSSNIEVSTNKTTKVETVTTTALPSQETTSKFHTSTVEPTEKPTLDTTTLSISPMNSTTEMNNSMPFTTTTENVATDTTLEKISLSTLTDSTVTDNNFTSTDMSTAEMTTISPNSNENKTVYVSADMKVTLNTTYNPALNDTSSAEYASFTQGFCSEIDRIYSNETTAFGNDYYGCTVTGISEGSVIVEFRIYCIELSLEQLSSESEIILQKYIGDSIQIGPDKLQIIVVTLINVQNEPGTDNPIIITTPPTKAKSTTPAVQCISEKPSSPSLKMHVDQVIDLGFYRSGSENECEAEVGYPPGNLIIEVKYNNSTQFEEIPPIDISYVDNSTIPGNCSNRQILKFGMNYSAAMDNGKIRCRVNHPIFSEIFSDEKDLHLIPRDICACNTVANGIKRGHPSRCDVYVECIQRVYPTGVACPADHCRNSLTGVCSSNCSEVVCREEVPSSFCTTPPPSTTTPAPSAYVSCNSSSALINSGPVNIVCSLNESTSFSSINITFTPAAESSPVLKSQIQANRSVTETDDNIIVTLVENVITITILNASCDTKGTYGVTVDINGDSAYAVGILTIVHNPGKPVLTLNADQVINLGFYRKGREHTCTGDVGLSTNQLIIEIQYYNQTDFQEFPESTIEVKDPRKEPFECPYKETITFGIKFTKEMDNAKIRCRVSGPMDNETQTVEDLALIPRDICSCGTNLGRRGHPNRCDVYIECIEENGVMYPIGARCVTGQCRNSLTGICSADCSVCDEEVPSDFCTTPAPTFTTPAPSPYIYCSDNTTLLNTGPVDLACFLNVTSFSLINITHQITADANSVMIAQIDNNANIHILDYNITFSVKFDINTIIITVQNATCSAQGMYRISVDLGEFSVIAQGHIKILSQPGRPIMKQNHLNIQGKGSTFSCTANVGNNPGTIEFVVRKHSDLNYTIVTTEDSNVEAGTVQQLTMECNNRQTVTYTPVLTSDWNLTSIKCRVKNEETISVYDESLYSSEYQTIVLIEENYCSADDVEYKIHPRGCNYYIRCVNSIIHSHICSSTLCFNFNMTQPACETCEPCISL